MIFDKIIYINSFSWSFCIGEYSILIISELFILFLFLKINNTIKRMIIIKIIDPKIIITSAVLPREESPDFPFSLSTFSSAFFDLISSISVLFSFFCLVSSVSVLFSLFGLVSSDSVLFSLFGLVSSVSVLFSLFGLVSSSLFSSLFGLLSSISDSPSSLLSSSLTVNPKWRGVSVFTWTK